MQKNTFGALLTGLAIFLLMQGIGLIDLLASNFFYEFIDNMAIVIMPMGLVFLIALPLSRWIKNKQNNARKYELSRFFIYHLFIIPGIMLVLGIGFFFGPDFFKEAAYILTSIGLVTLAIGSMITLETNIIMKMEWKNKIPRIKLFTVLFIYSIIVAVGSCIIGFILTFQRYSYIELGITLLTICLVFIIASVHFGYHFRRNLILEHISEITNDETKSN